MRIYALLPLLALAIIVICLTVPGCDKLVTETINNYIIDSNLAVECFKCHKDDDNKFLRPHGQWANSAHASARTLEAATDGDDCAACHSHEGYIKTFDSANISLSTYSVIGCFTCHKPHISNFDTLRQADLDSVMRELRGVSETYAIILGNGRQYFQFLGDRSIMCVNCHQAGFDLTTPNSQSASDLQLYEGWGPHYSGQADILTGTGGYVFTSAVSDTVHFAKASVSGGGCLSCHFGTGSGYEFGEHTFRLEDRTDSTQYVENCNQSGCHFTTPKTELFGDSITLAIADRADTLYQLLADQGVWDSTGENFLTGTLYNYRPDQARALYNYLLYKSDGSRGVHNPAYTNLLLSESIDYLPVRANLIIDPNSLVICTSMVASVTPTATGMVIDSLKLKFGTDSAYYHTFDSVYTYVFQSAGQYNVSMTAYGRVTGNESTVSGTITVYDSSAIPYFVVVDTLDNMSRAFLDSSRYATSWFWDFGDTNSTEDTSSLRIPLQPWTYSDTGTFTASLTVSGPCGVDSTMQLPVIIDTTVAP